MNKAVLIVEHIQDEGSIGVLFYYDKLPADTRKIVDDTLAGDGSVTCDVYEHGFQGLDESLIVPPGTPVMFVGSVDMYDDND
jgi:hypothetical protein